MSEVERVAEQAARQVVNAAIIRPGDTLIITVDHHLSDWEVGQLRERITERLDIDVALIEDVSGLAVYRPDPKPTI